MVDSAYTRSPTVESQSGTCKDRNSKETVENPLVVMADLCTLAASSETVEGRSSLPAGDVCRVDSFGIVVQAQKLKLTPYYAHLRLQSRRDGTNIAQRGSAGNSCECGSVP